MKQTNEMFHQSIVSFIKANDSFFNDLQRSYDKAEELLKGRLNKLLAEITIEDLNDLDSAKEQQLVIELGKNLTALKKASKRKVVMEYITTYLGLDLVLCRISLHAFDFFYIKNGMGDTSHFETLINGYYDGSLNEDQMCGLVGTIHNWQEAFNNHHLMRFDQVLFGMSYKTLKAIKQDCYEQTYATYATFKFRSDGVTIIRKDGTIVNG
jgi:hypothetical protein